MPETPQDIQKIYQNRFGQTSVYRNRVWQVLSRSFFNRWVNAGDSVLDLGCGYGEFINNICAGRKYAMDINPDTPKHLKPDIQFLAGDCAVAWPLPESTLDVVFSSNFFEHLPDKAKLRQTLQQAFRCLRPGGRLIALGPNIKYLSGRYWDYFDHHVILTEASLAEVLKLEGFHIERVFPRFLPYTMVNSIEYPLLVIRAYLVMPWLWWIKGRQFLVIAFKPN